MSRLTPKRPNSLPLPQSHRDIFLNGYNSRLTFTWFDLMPDFSWRKAKSKFIHIAFIVLVFIVLMVQKFKKSHLHGSNLSFCSHSRKMYMKGKTVCNGQIDNKYLTYQPPGGGWNNQRVAFENAVVIAKLLNRTLIVHPMAPHEELLRIKKLHPFDLGYEAYNKLPTEKLLPLSKVIDLSRLSKLLPVKEILTNHPTFVEDFRHLSWYRVCHNGLQGIWVDSLPSKQNIKAWNALIKHAKHLHHNNVENIPTYRRSCKADMARYSYSNDTPFWGIIDELSQRTENIIYFEEGSMFFRKMLFLSKSRTLDAHKWVIRFITFAAPIWERLRRIQRLIASPFNAVHVRRTDHPKSRHLSQDNWLGLLRKRNALNITSNLYVATDEKNMTWFDPFRNAGYNLMFAKTFIKELTDLNNSSYWYSQDIIGMTEQLICARAHMFVGSYYSTFSLYIKRLRAQSLWMGQLLHQPYILVTWVKSS